MPSKSSSYKSATRSTERNTNDQSFRNDPAVIEQTGRVEDATFGEDLELELEQSTAQEHDRLLQSDDEGDELTFDARKSIDDTPSRFGFLSRLFKSNTKIDKDGKKVKEVSYWSIPHKEQIILLVLCRIIEPLVSNSIAPYLYYMIESFGYTEPSEISALGTIVMSSFALGQALTGVVWGTLSDKYGRKPILICGLIGTAISTLLFGFSTNVWSASLARICAGALNGNVGVMRTMMAELVADHKEYQTRAFTIMPLTVNVAVVVGPVLGGLLANPYYTYPDKWWAHQKIFEKYPYLLPNLFPFPVLFLGMTMLILFLEETSESPNSLLNSENDYGLKLGKLIKRGLSKLFRRQRDRRESFASFDERHEILSNDEEFSLDPYESDEEQPKKTQDSRSQSVTNVTSTSSSSSSNVSTPVPAPAPVPEEPPKELTLREIMTKPVRVTLIAYTLLMFHCPAFLHLLPLFMATPRFILKDGHGGAGNNSTAIAAPNIFNSTTDLYPGEHLPLIFNGGLGMPSARIGTAMAAMGATGVALQFLVYPRVAFWLGNAKSHRLSLRVFPLAYALVPFIGLLTRIGYVPNFGTGGDNPSNTTVSIAGGADLENQPGIDNRWTTTAAIIPIAMMVILGRTFAIPPMPVLVTNAASSRKVLGRVHGLASSVTSIARCLGPFLLGNLYSFGVKIGVVGLAWWVMAFVVMWEIVISRNLREWGEEVDVSEPEEQSN